MRGVILGGERDGPAELVLELGDATVTISARPYDPVRDEAERSRVAHAAMSAEDAGALLDLLQPGAQAAMAAMDSSAIEAAGTIWLAALIGAHVVEGWEGVTDDKGEALPFTVDRWQLACFTIPGFARAFLISWMRPRTVEIAAGNASAPVPSGRSRAGRKTARVAGNA